MLPSDHVYVAIRRGDLVPADACESCGVREPVDGWLGHRYLQAHHDDYSRPLDVRWLCPTCHSGWHRVHGKDGLGRREVVEVRIGEAEKAEYQAAADHAGVTLSMWVRDACHERMRCENAPPVLPVRDGSLYLRFET